MIMQTVALNSTTSAISSLGDPTMSWFGGAMITGIIGILLTLFIMTIASLEGYIRTRKYLMFILNSFKYFMFGILSLIVLALPVSVFYYFLKQAHEGNVAPLKISLGLIGGYILISLIGYLSKRFVYERIKKFEKKVKK